MNNVVGKLLVILNLVFSIMFMCFAGAVFTFQGQWRAKAETLQGQVDNLSENLKEEQEQNDQELEELNAELKAVTDARNTAQAEVEDARSDEASLLGQLQEVRQEAERHLAQISVAEAEATARLEETKVLRSEVQRLRDAMASLNEQIRDKEDENLELNGLVTRATSLEKQTADEIARLRGLLRANNIDPKETISGPVPAEIVKVDGKVLGTQKNRSGSSEFVLVSIGSDDKVNVGNRLYVYRQNKFLAEIRLVEVQADQAVGIVDETKRGGSIVRGDNVTTKL